MKALFRKSLVVFYWVTLPLALLACAGWLVGAAMDPSSARSWTMAGGTAAFAGLIGWRLWLNSRAAGWGGPMPPRRRLLLVFLPLAALALTGVGVAAAGVALLGLGIALLASPDAADIGFPDLASGAALYLGGGVLIVLAGAGLTVPLLRRLRRKPAAADSF